jgi:hypothetical protein
LFLVAGQGEEAAPVLDPLHKQRYPLQRGDYLLRVLYPISGTDEAAGIAVDKRSRYHHEDERSGRRPDKQHYRGIRARRSSKPSFYGQGSAHEAFIDR